MSPELDVLIGADSLAMRRSGVGRMTFEIVRAARRVAEIGTISLMMHGRVHPVTLADTLGEPDGTESSVTAFNWKARIIDLPGMGAARQARQMLITRRINSLAHDRLVYYEPNMIARPVAIPTVVTINDLSWHHEPSWHPADRLAWIDRHLKQTLRSARHFTALSQFTKDSAVAALGIAADRITVVPLAPADAFRPFTTAEAAPVLARFDLEDRAYILSISTIEPRKNFDRLFAAHQKLPAALRQRAPLVIAGGKGWGQGLNAAATEAAIRRGELRMLGHIADHDLVALTARAGVFAYVSLYEGFGLPVIEADGGRLCRGGIQHHVDPGGCRRRRPVGRPFGRSGHCRRAAIGARRSGSRRTAARGRAGSGTGIHMGQHGGRIVGMLARGVGP